MNSYIDLKEKKLFVLDMDGTFYLGNKIIEGSLDFIEKIKATNRDFVFFTNNSSKNSEFYKNKLKKMGCDVNSSRIITSGDVTINYLKQNYSNKKVYLLGTEYLKKNFEQAGINLVESNPDIVVVGFDMELTYDSLSKACKYIREGCTFIATHLDLNCPTEDGFIPDCGAICALITASTGIQPTYLGKPFTETMYTISKKTGYKKEEIVFIGDRLYTDIAIGFKNGVTSILVLSGETKEQDLKSSEIQPDYIFKSLANVAQVI